MKIVGDGLHFLHELQEEADAYGQACRGIGEPNSIDKASTDLFNRNFYIHGAMDIFSGFKLNKGGSWNQFRLEILKRVL